MDFAEVARSFPQFGKSMRNLIRSRAAVFHSQENGTRCENSDCCSDGSNSKVQCAHPRCIECAEGDVRDFFDEGRLRSSFLGGPSHTLVEKVRFSKGGLVAAVCASEEQCCVSIYCYPVDIPKEFAEFGDKPRFSHCYFLVKDCEGRSWRLHLDPNQANIEPPQDHGFGEGNLVTLTADHVPDPRKDKLEWSVCEPCVMCGQSSCGLADCLVSEAADYPLAQVQEQERPLNGETILDIILFPGSFPTYKLLGPNSNTFVAYVARKCGLPPLKQFGSNGRLPAIGAQSAEDRHMKNYMRRHEGWLADRHERWLRERGGR
jgi:hypothetical protein